MFECGSFNDVNLLAIKHTSLDIRIGVLKENFMSVAHW